MKSAPAGVPDEKISLDSGAARLGLRLVAVGAPKFASFGNNMGKTTPPVAADRLEVFSDLMTAEIGNPNVRAYQKID
jgi:hypothetical protein